MSGPSPTDRSAPSENVPLPALTLEADGRSPRFFYGWVMLPIAMAGVVASSPAQTFGVAPFNEHFRETLGLSETQLTAAYGLGTLLAALPMGLVGTAMDRYGIRRVKTVVILLFGLACLFTALAQNLVMLFFAFFFLRLLGQGALGGLLSGSTLAFWFEKKLGTIEGLRHLGIAGAIAVVPGFIFWLIHQVGWRWTYVVLGLVVWAVMLPLMLFFRNRPEDIGQRKDGLAEEFDPRPAAEADEEETPGAERDFTPAEARRTPAYWLSMLPLAAWALTNTAVMFSAVPLLTERGVARDEVPILFTLFSVGFAVMIVTGGVLADRMPLNFMLAIGVGCMATSWALLRYMGEVVMPGLVYPAGLLMGLTQGLLVAVMSPLWPRYFGRAHLGKLKSTLVALTVAASASGPFLMGWTRELTGSYDLALTLFTLACLPLAFAALAATPPVYPPPSRGAG